jgi:hypothetical protein
VELGKLDLKHKFCTMYVHLFKYSAVYVQGTKRCVMTIIRIPVRNYRPEYFLNLTL